MSAPAIPVNFNVQQGNGQVWLTWDLVPGATTYPIQRSTDGVTYAALAAPATNYYLDTSVTIGTNYYYKVASSNGTASPYTTPQAVVPTLTADMSLGQLRLYAQQRADRVNSNFVTMPEWNTYLNQSYFELYDLLITTYEDYYTKATPYTFSTDGTTAKYTLPTDFYKLQGVDCGVGASSNAFQTVHNFNFIDRNRYMYPGNTSTFLGVFNLRYRLFGNTLFFIPTPQGGQTIRVWYIPRLEQLLKDTDIASGVSGWLEYVIVDAAIKALQKEEADISALAGQKEMLRQRIQDSAMNRDAGQPQKISNTRNDMRYGNPGDDGPFGGY